MGRYIVLVGIAFFAYLSGCLLTRYTIESNSMMVESKNAGVVYSCHVRQDWGW